MTQSQFFNPARLTLARKRRGLTMTKVALKLGVDLRTVSGYENGEYKPSEENVSKLVDLLRFPREFFFGPDIEELSPDSASFRSLSRMSAGLRDTALGAGALALHLNTWIESRFDLPKAQLPDLSSERDPEAAAELVRGEFGLGKLPVKNMVHLLESKGVRVFSLAIDAKEVDAFSMWRQDTPFVFLNTRKSAEHSRFDAAHELGHLVMHRHGAPQGQDAEREANAFASAFLMPRGSVLAEAPHFPSVETLIQLKKLWNVSVAALAYRLKSVGAISEWHYRNLAVEISRRGYRKREPNESPREMSQVFAKVAASLKEEGVTKHDIARELAIPVQEIEQLLFGLALTGITEGTGPNTRRVREQPALYLVQRSVMAKKPNIHVVKHKRGWSTRDRKR